MAKKSEAPPDLDGESFGDTDGENIAGGDGGFAWLPHLVELSEAKKKESLSKYDKGASARGDMAGKLIVVRAWGRTLYALDVTRANGERLAVRMPEHTALYSALNSVKMGAQVKVVYAGRAKTGKPGQQKAHVYDVFPAKGFALSKEREDALTIQRKDDDAEAPPF